MSHWNYRLVRTKNPSPTAEIEGEYRFSIREVYYNDKEEIVAISESDMSPWGEDVEDIKRSLARMTAACDKDILVEEDIVYGDW